MGKKIYSNALVWKLMLFLLLLFYSCEQNKIKKELDALEKKRNNLLREQDSLLRAAKDMEGYLYPEDDNKNE